MTTNRNVSTTITGLLRVFIAIVVIMSIMAFVGCSSDSPTQPTITDTTQEQSQDNSNIYRLDDPEKDGIDEDVAL